MRLALSLLAVLAVASIASAAALDRSVPSPGKVEALARSGYSVAYAAAPVKVTDCHQPALWSLVSRGVKTFGPRTGCEETSTGRGIAGLAVSHSRLLWLEYAGGNYREFQLYTATRTSPKPRELDFEAVDVDSGLQPIVVGVASEYVLPYSVGSAVKVLRDNGKLLYTWKAPARVTNLTAYGDSVAVFVVGGKCYLLSRGGSVQQTYTFPVGAVQEFALSRAGLLVQLLAGKVQIWNAKGALARELTLPAEARMRDYEEGILLYSLKGQIRGRKVFSGKDALIRTAGAQAPLARLERNGLSYAIGKTVYSVAMVNVQAAFH